MVFLLAAVVVPVLSLGYNPYSAMEASRSGDEFVGYRHGEKGLMWVRSSKGFGLRDRYGIIIPAQYTQIEFLDNMKPYVKVKEGTNEWGLYDIERKEYITTEYYENIELYGKNIIRLQKDSCYHYMNYEEFYNWDSEEAQHVFTDTIPKQQVR